MQTYTVYALKITKIPLDYFLRLWYNSSIAEFGKRKYGNVVEKYECL